jgi:hypothetical protein
MKRAEACNSLQRIQRVRLEKALNARNRSEGTPRGTPRGLERSKQGPSDATQNPPEASLSCSSSDGIELTLSTPDLLRRMRALTPTLLRRREPSDADKQAHTDRPEKVDQEKPAVTPTLFRRRKPSNDELQI